MTEPSARPFTVRLWIRQILLALVWIPLTACTNGGTTDTSDATDTESECHPLVPEEYCFLWNLDQPCELGGPRTYRVVEAGTVDDSGSGVLTERWYGFYPDGEADDFVDVVELSVSTSGSYSAADLDCPQCDVVFEIEAKGVDVQSGWAYDGKAEVVALDWVNPNGDFQEDKSFVMARGYINSQGNLQDVKPSYARGVYEPTSGTPGALPGVIRWEPFSTSGSCRERW